MEWGRIEERGVAAARIKDSRILNNNSPEPNEHLQELFEGVIFRLTIFPPSFGELFQLRLSEVKDGIEDILRRLYN